MAKARELWLARNAFVIHSESPKYVISTTMPYPNPETKEWESAYIIEIMNSQSPIELKAGEGPVKVRLIRA